MSKHIIFPCLFLLFCGCAGTRSSQEMPLTSMQLLDRNGFSETISSKDRLSAYAQVDFLAPQSYQKVLRVYKRNQEGKPVSKVTSYHSNGHVWQYLETLDGRAHGLYKEWYPNGQLKMELHVIEGTADITEVAQTTWVFEGENRIFNEQGALLATIHYDKGMLQGPSLYYHPNGTLQKSIFYKDNLIEGEVPLYDEQGHLVEKLSYKHGLREGISEGYVDAYQEEYKEDRLLNASYFDKEGKRIAEICNGCGKQAVVQEGKLHMLIEYQEGFPEGEIQTFSAEGHLKTVYHVKEGKKEGEEIEYYPPSKEGILRPKISFSWHEDVLQGMVKTWYENGMQESQREMSSNKKEGLSIAWYQNGDLMFAEEYENHKLVKGSYYKKGDKLAVSKIENGKGTATLYDGQGRFLKKVAYEKSAPLLDE